MLYTIFVHFMIFIYFIKVINFFCDKDSDKYIFFYNRKYIIKVSINVKVSGAKSAVFPRIWATLTLMQRVVFHVNMQHS